MTTVPEHMPERHAQHQQWTPGRLMNWAKSIGPEVLKWVKAQLQRKAHPELAYRICLGLLNLKRTYPADRLNQACAIANQETLFKIKVWVTNMRYDGRNPRSQSELAAVAADNEPKLSFLFPGIWLLNISSRLKNFIEFVPINGQKTRYYLRDNSVVLQKAIMHEIPGASCPED